MSKIAFIFPGQGSQYVGMGKGFYDNYAVAKEVYDLAEKATGLDVKAICFEENDKINQTEYTQIAMFTTEVATLKVIEKMGLKADICAGLSLGEYGALAATDVLTVEELCALVRKRGIYMQNACPTGGAMAAILGLDIDTVTKVCDETEGLVHIANYNCPGQLVITGEEKAVLTAADSLKEAGAKRCVPLKVSGPFHSEMLSKASESMAEELKNLEPKAPSVPYYSNVEATKVTTAEPIRDLLAKQVISPVKWQQTVEKMIAEGVDTFIEIGPGKSLSGFMGRINKEVKTYNVDKVEDLEKIKELL